MLVDGIIEKCIESIEQHYTLNSAIEFDSVISSAHCCVAQLHCYLSLLFLYI